MLGPHIYSGFDDVATYKKLLMSPCGLRRVMLLSHQRKSLQQTTLVFRGKMWRMLYMLNKMLPLKAG